jgi:hypothetical protein
MGVRLVNLDSGQSLVAIARNAESIGDAIDAGDDEITGETDQDAVGEPAAPDGGPAGPAGEGGDM